MTEALASFYLWVGWEPYTWLTLFMIATIADGVTTLYALKHGGREANPVMRFAMRAVTPPVAIFAIKGLNAAMVFSSILINILWLPPAAMFFMAISVWNTSQIIRLILDGAPTDPTASQEGQP